MLRGGTSSQRCCLGSSLPPPQAYDQSANVIAEFMSCLDLHNMLCESKVSLLQVQSLKTGRKFAII